MSIPIQFYSQQSPMQPIPTLSHHQPTFQPDFHLQIQQQHQLQQQQALQLQLQQQLQFQQQQQQQQQQHQYHQQIQQHFMQQQQIQQFIINQQQNYGTFPNNSNQQSPAQYGPLCFVYPQAMNNFIMPRNEPSGDNLSSFGSVSNLTSVLPRDNNNNTSFQIISKNPTQNQFNLVTIPISSENGAKQEQSKDNESSLSQHLNHKEESTKLSCSSSTKAPKMKKLLLEMCKSNEKSRTASTTANEINPSMNQIQFLELKKKQKTENEDDDDEMDSISECRENENNCEGDDDMPASERKRVKKEKAATQKAENKKIKEKLLAMSNSAQKELLLQIQQVSKQNSAKAFLKAYKRFALGKQQYIYNYDISENQYYYKVCHDMPLLRIEDPSKKDLEGFYRKFKKFFLGKQYNNNTLKTVVRNKLYGQLFDDFLRTQADEWLEHSKSKNKDDLRIIIKFLLMCHDDPDYLVFLRDHDKSKDVKSVGNVLE